MTNPKVSVCLITYNQENYVRQALDGVVSQQCPFPFEVVVSDDYSTDKTADIIKEYAAKYPFIVVLDTGKNLGMHRNWEKAISACKGEYIALLEGDDFWNDDLKLQKQVALMDKDKSIAFSFTNAYIKNEGSMTYNPEYVPLSEGFYEMSDLLAHNYPPTCSVVFRRSLFSGFPAAYFRSPYADWILHIMNATKGRVYFMNEKTCTYRSNPGGVFGKSDEVTRLKRRAVALGCVCEILQGTQWYEPAKAKRRDARYALKRYFLDKKDYLNYIKSYFV